MLPYGTAGLCMLFGCNLYAHAKPEKVKAVKRYSSYLNPPPKRML